ncbi:hypothetical protein B0H67DRAFT_3678 [Lasiosphaeris hirsuta]|uniref:Transmembrane protein n=1 Tax=Lasiosphaeris hirsuta TaxID=260670 RepID=A0AA40B8M7_9PEZI|nr:hypothetical protein B0H67DRAFT_3678 [Lasiosphaeris hirsuta]
MAPTPTIPLLGAIVGRQGVTVTVAPSVPTTTVTVVPDNTNTYTTTSGSSLGPGAIAGIVIGVIVGLLLLWWLFRMCNKPARAPDSDRQGWYDDGRGGAHAHGHHHHSHSRGHRGSRSRSRSHHHHRRSITPVVLEEKPRRPSATYVVDGRRSRSASRGYYVS